MDHLNIFKQSRIFCFAGLKKETIWEPPLPFFDHCAWVCNWGIQSHADLGLREWMIPGLPTKAVCLFKMKQIWSVQLGWCASVKEHRSPDHRSVNNLQSLRIKRKVRAVNWKYKILHGGGIFIPMLQNNMKRRQRKNWILPDGRD